LIFSFPRNHPSDNHPPEAVHCCISCLSLVACHSLLIRHRAHSKLICCALSVSFLVLVLILILPLSAPLPHFRLLSVGFDIDFEDNEACVCVCVQVSRSRILKIRIHPYIQLALSVFWGGGWWAGVGMSVCLSLASNTVIYTRHSRCPDALTSWPTPRSPLSTTTNTALI